MQIGKLLFLFLLSLSLVLQPAFAWQGYRSADDFKISSYTSIPNHDRSFGFWDNVRNIANGIRSFIADVSNKIYESFSKLFFGRETVAGYKLDSGHELSGRIIVNKDNSIHKIYQGTQLKLSTDKLPVAASDGNYYNKGRLTYNAKTNDYDPGPDSRIASKDTVKLAELFKRSVINQQVRSEQVIGRDYIKSAEKDLVRFIEEPAVERPISDIVTAMTSELLNFRNEDMVLYVKLANDTFVRGEQVYKKDLNTPVTNWQVFYADGAKQDFQVVTSVSLDLGNHFTDRPKVDYSHQLRDLTASLAEALEKPTEPVRFNNAPDLGVYQPAINDHGNGTCTVDMPLNWFSPGNVVKSLVELTHKPEILKGAAAQSLINRANGRWEKSVSQAVDELAQVVNSGKFQVVEVPGVNSHGLGVEALSKIKRNFGLNDNQTLIIAHSAGTELTARALSHIEIKNKDVYVFFLSPRMKAETMELYLTGSQVPLQNILTVNSSRDFPNWSDSRFLGNVKPTYLGNDQWTHIYLKDHVVSDGQKKDLGHGSMYDGLINGNKYLLRSNNKEYDGKEVVLSEFYRSFMEDDR